MIAYLRKRLQNNFLLFLVGGTIYFIIEYVYKTFISKSGSITHWSMFVVGGICFVAIGLLNEVMEWDWSLLRQALCGTGIVTSIEFVAGCILNLWLKLGVWDYSHLPFNILGQVCLPFCVIWFFISILTIYLDDYLRWVWFGEEKPHYHWI